MTDNENSTPENAGRKQDKGRFPKGQSGNPAGKPRGARHRYTMAAQALLDGEAEALTRKAVEKALEGDMAALRLCLERVLPVRKGAPITFEMPAIDNAENIAKAIGAVVSAVAAGELSPDEGAVVTGLLETKRKAIETSEIEKRLAALEGRTK